jgi:hypothetical protein
MSFPWLFGRDINGLARSVDFFGRERGIDFDVWVG